MFAKSHCGFVGSKDHAAILKRSSLLEIGKKKYYNLQQKWRRRKIYKVGGP